MDIYSKNIFLITPDICSEEKSILYIYTCIRLPTLKCIFKLLYISAESFIK